MGKNENKRIFDLSLTLKIETRFVPDIVFDSCREPRPVRGFSGREEDHALLRLFLCWIDLVHARLIELVKLTLVAWANYVLSYELIVGHLYFVLLFQCAMPLEEPRLSPPKGLRRSFLSPPHSRISVPIEAAKAGVP